MPAIRSSSDLQRNISAIYELCDKAGEPVYVTRNGEASLVVMNADAFEDLLARQDELEQELELYKALMQSEIDRLSGNTYSWEDIRRQRQPLGSEVA